MKSEPFHEICLVFIDEISLEITEPDEYELHIAIWIDHNRINVL